MTQRFLNDLLDEASRPFRGGGHFAYHYARAKLSSDSIFREILRRGLFPAAGDYLDLGCGQGNLFAWLLAARKLYEVGNWPHDWPAAPEPLALRGVEPVSYTHLDVYKRQAQATLAEVGGQAPRFFRPTAGLRNPFLDPVLAGLDLQLASWTRRSFDTREGDPGTVLSRLAGKLAAGDVLLLHDGHAARTPSGEPVILAVLPRLLATVRERQLKPVTLYEATS